MTRFGIIGWILVSLLGVVLMWPQAVKGEPFAVFLVISNLGLAGVWLNFLRGPL